ncbi:DUF3102 domain-containing protein [Falsiroseomonas sp. E2-1-a20]|uniref:DUF3102 domain-containing protein n=1 Tax=Falsiroseomonas sp. E2-1-a20 TaxID=3239300 RepID=UPI003F2CCB22
MSRRLKLDAPPPPVLIEGDARVRALQIAKTEPRLPQDYVSEISRLWSRAQGAFLEIGRLLIRAKEMLPHGEYVASVEAELPFSSRTAYQLREAARWALGGPIPMERLPGSYSTIYLLSTLEPPVLDAAEKDGLIRPELKRAELIEWRRRRGGGQDLQGELRAKLERLRRERMRIDEEMRRLEQELAEGDEA